MSDNNANEICEIRRKYINKNYRQRACKQIIHRLDLECFGIKYKKSKSSGRRMGKYKAKEVKDLSDYVRENRMKKKNRHKEIKLAKSVTKKIMKVGEFIIGPKHKPAERMAIYDTLNNDLITVKN